MANIELDGANKKITVDSGDLTLDIPGDIVLDADGANVTFKDGGTSILDISNSSSDAVITSSVQDKDIIFKGDDGGSAVTAATFDMSDAGTLVLNHDLRIGDAGQIGSASDADAIAIASNGVVTFSQAPVFPDGSLAVADLDIDGATDIGADIVDADLFIIDDGAGGTNRKTTASRLKTYVGGGITGYDRFKLSSSFTGDSQPITSNLSRTAHGEFEKIGSGMSESSGVFTFPETGLWKIGFQAQFYGDANAYGRIQINWSTNSGTSYTSSGWADTSSWGQPNGNNGNYRTITAAILNVTNASTFRVRVEAEQQDDSDGSVYGAGSDVTFIEFTRLADSQ